MITKTVRDIDLPITYHLIALRGDTLKSEVFTHIGPDNVTPINFTGSTITCKGALSDGTAIDLTEHLVIDKPNGEYYLSVPPSVTNGATPWPEGLGSYDITIEDSNAEIITYFAGSLGLTEGSHV